MLYNEENKEHVVVLTGSDKNNMKDSVTGDGVPCYQTYSMDYKFDKSGLSRNLLTINGLEMVKSLTRVLNNWFSEEQDLGEIRRVLQMFVVLYSTSLLNPQHFRKIKKDYPKDIVMLVKKGMKGKGQSWLILKDCISTYLYLTLIMCKEENEYYNKNKVTLCDSVGIDDSSHIECWKDETSESYWKIQNITKRLGLKTFEEFIHLHSRGVIHYEWTNLGVGRVH